MTQSLEELNKEVCDLYDIRQKLIKKEAKEEDLVRLQELADLSKSPLAEFLYGAIHYFGEAVEQDRAKAFRYFDLSRAHASGDIQMRMARIYFREPENYWQRGVECVEAAAKDHHPLARKMVRTAKMQAAGMTIKSFFGFGSIGKN
jgi:TPR repeat protein